MAGELMTNADLVDLLHRSAAQIGALAESAAPAVLRTPPAPGVWSAVEVLAHLRACGDMWGGAITRILTEEHPSIRAISPRTWIRRTNYPDLEFAASYRAYASQRAELLTVLAQLPAADWLRAATVSVAGKPTARTVRSYTESLATHERSHLGQFAAAVGATQGNDA